ncbi:MAG: hypothetical protein M3R02_04500 [Chloroflexota bacterium]|nr:hypothetical protein [Chloroflexota bacterium]
MSATTRLDAQLDARAMGSDALLTWRDVLALDAADPDPDYPGPVGRYLATERLAAVETELLRREQLAQATPRLVRAQTQTHNAWRDVARVVRERVEVPDLFHALAGPIAPAGRNSRRGAPEYSASCPACGGEDRLRLWGGPDGRAWCRQCNWSADVIALAQSFAPGCAGFRDAVTWLATIAHAEVG